MLKQDAANHLISHPCHPIPLLLTHLGSRILKWGIRGANNDLCLQHRCCVGVDEAGSRARRQDVAADGAPVLSTRWGITSSPDRPAGTLSTAECHAAMITLKRCESV